MTTALSTIPNTSFVSFSSPEDVFSQMRAIEHELAQTAFNLFERRGFAPGLALNDWVNAESMLLKSVPISIEEKGNQIVVKADVPGFSPEQLKVSIDNNMLCLCGKEEQSQKTGEKTEETAETKTVRKIHCKVALSGNVDSKRATATLDKGVLTLTLPKVETSTRIDVKAA